MMSVTLPYFVFFNVKIYVDALNDLFGFNPCRLPLSQGLRRVSTIYEEFKKNPEAVNNVVPTYDGHKSLYTAKPLSAKQEEMDVLLSEGEGEGTPSTSLLISSLIFAILFIFFMVILNIMYFD